MRVIRASSPTKAIIAGEHSVVYGGLGLAIPLNNRKECECVIAKAESGKGGISVEDSVGSGKYFPDGNCEDADGWFGAKAKLLEHVLKTERRSINNLKISLKFSRNRVPKGTGHSASTAAVLALCLYEALEIPAGKEKLFEAIQAFEAVAHAGIPSGIDARTVLSDQALKFRKIFLRGGKQRFEYEDVKLALPASTVLVIANTAREGEALATTAEMLKIFADAKGIARPPADLTDGERSRITKPFDLLVEGMLLQLHGKGDAKKLGALMKGNHALLKEAGVSSDGIEEAVKIAIRHGAFGAKLTGAGGNGGAVLALCREKDAEKMLKALGEEGMNGVKAELSGRGAYIRK